MFYKNKKGKHETISWCQEMKLFLEKYTADTPSLVTNRLHTHISHNFDFVKAKSFCFFSVFVVQSSYFKSSLFISIQCQYSSSSNVLFNQISALLRRQQHHKMAQVQCAVMSPVLHFFFPDVIETLLCHELLFHQMQGRRTGALFGLYLVGLGLPLINNKFI